MAAAKLPIFLGEVWDLPERGGWNMIAAALRVSSHERNTSLGFFFSQEAFLGQDSFLIDAYTSGQLESLAVCLTVVGDFRGYTGILSLDHRP